MKKMKKICECFCNFFTKTEWSYIIFVFGCFVISLFFLMFC